MARGNKRGLLIGLLIGTLLVVALAVTVKPRGTKYQPHTVDLSGDARSTTKGGTSKHTNGGSTSNTSGGDRATDGRTPVETAASGDPESGALIGTTRADGVTTPTRGVPMMAPAFGEPPPLPDGALIGGYDADGNPIYVDKEGNPIDPEYAQREGEEGGTGDGSAEPTPTPIPLEGQAVVGGTISRGESLVAEALVTLTDSTGTQLSARSDVQGRYYFPPVEPGEYMLFLRSPASPRPGRGLVLEPDDRRLSEDYVIPMPDPVTGMVVDDTTGSGVPRPTISVFQGIRGFAQVRGDDTGWFQLSPLDPGTYVLKVVADGFLPGEESITVPSEGATAPVTIRLQPAVQVAGRVLRPDGTPAAGALVGLFSPGGVWGGPYSDQPIQQTRSDGTFVFTSLPTGAGPVRVGAYLAGTVPGYSGVIDPGTGSGDAGAIKLSAGATVTGRAVNTAGEPIDFVRIDINGGFAESGAIFQKFSIQLPMVETGSDGRFQLRGIEPGATVVRLTAEDYLSKDVPTTVAAPTHNLGDIELEASDEAKPGRITGLVIDNTGKGIAGMYLWLRCDQCAESFEALQTTDTLGRFTFEDLPEDGYMWATLSGATLRGSLYIPLSGRWGGSKAGGDPWEIVYDMSHTIAFRLVDGGGQPILRATAGVTVEDSGPGQTRLYMQYQDDLESVDGTFRLQHLIAGVSTVTISVAGVGSIQRENIAISPGTDTVELGELSIGEGARLSGLVVAEESGASLQGVSIKLAAPRGTGANTHPFSAVSFATSTGANGMFELSGIPTATGDIYFERSGRVRQVLRDKSFEAGETTDVGTITMAPSATIQGRVTSARDGKPLYNVQLTVGWDTKFTDREGYYRVDTAEPGTISIRAVYNDANDPHDDAVLSIEAVGGQTTTLDIPLNPSTTN